MTIIHIDSLYHTLVRIFKTYRTHPHVEIEIRLGWKTSKMFDTNIGKTYYDTIISILSTMQDADISTIQDEIYIFQNRRYIVSNNKNRVYGQLKSRIEFIDFELEGTPFDLRISVCKEEPISIEKQPLPEHIPWIRKRNRTSIQYKMWNYDITHVELQKPRNDDEDTCTIYEFEIELNNNYKDLQGYSNSYLAHSLYLKLLDILQFEYHSEKCNLKNLNIINQTSN